MSKSLKQILGFAPLTEALRTVASGVPNPFPPEFFAVQPANRVIGDRATYIRISGERRTSKLAKYGSPSRRRTLRDIGDQNARMMHTFEDFQVDPAVLLQLRSFEQYQQDKGMDWLRYQIEEAARRHQNSRVISTASVLRYGAIYWNSDGDLLPSSSGAAETYSFQVPATHQNQINGNISASWALHTTDLLGDIRNVKLYSLQETGMEIEAALYGKNVPKYVMQNDYAMSYLSRNTSMNEKLLSSGEIPDGFGGIKRWIPVWKSLYESDDNGTVSIIWNDDMVTFMPNIDQPDKMTWWSFFEGSFPVPKTIDVQKNPATAIDAFETVFGMFSYAAPTHNPPGLTVYHGDVWLPGLRNEKSIYQAVVAF